jgi:hypothetical protein
MRYNVRNKNPNERKRAKFIGASHYRSHSAEEDSPDKRRIPEACALLQNEQRAAYRTTKCGCQTCSSAASHKVHLVVVVTKALRERHVGERLPHPYPSLHTFSKPLSKPKVVDLPCGIPAPIMPPSCTIGPSGPTASPDDTQSTCVKIRPKTKFSNSPRRTS